MWASEKSPLAPKVVNGDFHQPQTLGGTLRIDPIVDTLLKEFCDRYGLHVHTRYRDEEVRSISVVDDSGVRYQIWLDDSTSDLVVKTSDNRSKSYSAFSTESGLAHALENAYNAVLAWIEAAGNTRTPT